MKTAECMNCRFPMAINECKNVCPNCNFDYGWDVIMSRVDVELKHNMMTIKEKDYDKKENVDSDKENIPADTGH